MLPFQPEDLCLKLIRKDARFFYKIQNKTKKMYTQLVKDSIWIPGSSLDFIKDFHKKFVEYYSHGHFDINDSIVLTKEFMTAIRTFKSGDEAFLKEALISLYQKEWHSKHKI